MTTVTRNSPLLLVRETDGVTIDLAPLQGLWTVDQYLKLTDHTRCLVEFSHGNLEVLPMPTQRPPDDSGIFVPRVLRVPAPTRQVGPLRAAPIASRSGSVP
jgi:hypothetical protein